MDAHAVFGSGCVLLGLALALTKRQGETSLLLTALWPTTQPDDVVILDRAYADYRLLAQSVAHGPCLANNASRLAEPSE